MPPAPMFSIAAPAAMCCAWMLLAAIAISTSPVPHIRASSVPSAIRPGTLPATAVQAGGLLPEGCVSTLAAVGGSSIASSRERVE